MFNRAEDVRNFGEYSVRPGVVGGSIALRSRNPGLRHRGSYSVQYPLCHLQLFNIDSISTEREVMTLVSVNGELRKPCQVRK